MGGSETTSSTNQATKTEIPAEIRNRGTKITTGAMKTYFDPAKKYQSYTSSNPQASTYQNVGEQTTGQLNEFHDQAGDNFTNAGSSYQPYFNEAKTTSDQAATNTAQNATGPNYNSATVGAFADPYKDAVLDDGTRRLTEAHDINRTKLNDQAAKTGGAFGGTRNAVEQSLNTKNFNNTLGDFTNTVNSQAFKDAQGQFNTDWSQKLATTQANNQAAGQNYNQGQTTAEFQKSLGKDTQGAQIAAGDAQLKLGNVKTAQEDAEKTTAYSKGYLDQRDYPMDTYERLAAMNAMQPVNRTSTTTGSNTQSQSGGWLGPALQAGGSVAAMMSDERVKEDIEDVDAEDVLGAFAKIQPKSYAYKDEVVRDYPELAKEGRRTGFMAQDLEGAFGREMGSEVDGIKTVDIPEVLGELVAAVHGLEKRTRSLRKEPRA
jgi:hypothetical protein